MLAGPFTPGYVADQHLATELAEIGVILLMFGVGLHFSLKDLLAVRTIAVPGALAQMAVATALGIGLAALMGWPLSAGLVFGLALSVASTVVLLRALQERRLIQTDRAAAQYRLAKIHTEAGQWAEARRVLEGAVKELQGAMAGGPGPGPRGGWFVREPYAEMCRELAAVLDHLGDPAAGHPPVVRC